MTAMKGKTRCDMCAAFFKHVTVLEKTPGRCEVCGKIFKLQKVPRKDIHQCRKCMRTFRNCLLLRNHYRIHRHPNSLVCYACDRTFDELNYLHLHLKWHALVSKCRVNLTALSIGYDGGVYLYGQEHPPKHVCFFCQAEFCGNNSLQRHLNESHRSQLQYRKELENETNVPQNHQNAQGGRRFRCWHCKRSFATASVLTKHIRVHFAVKPYQCNFCGKTFRLMNELNKHVKTHTGERPFKCDFCYKGFITSGHMAVHRRVHTGHRPYKCDLCDKTFTIVGNLQKHKFTHTGLKPFTCDICEMKFTLMSNLRKHLARHSQRGM